jgi:ribonuclease P protein component
MALKQAGGSAVKDESFSKSKIPFSVVYAEGKSWAEKELVLRALPNKLDSSRFGFVVSRRIGNAVVRNHIKRLLRELTRQMAVKAGWDIVLIARIPSAITGFEDLGKSVRKLFFRAGLCVNENENISTLDD